MFTGIIETLGIIKEIEKDQENLHVTVESEITHELKIDQSVAHNGICLTVVKIENKNYTVTAIKETIDKTSIGTWKAGGTIAIGRIQTGSANFGDFRALCAPLERTRNATIVSPPCPCRARKDHAHA